MDVAVELGQWAARCRLDFLDVFLLEQAVDRLDAVDNIS